MVDTDKIRGLMAEKRVTGKDMARVLDISPNTFSAKMKTGVFTTNEMQKIVDYLDIANPMPIFFAEKVTSDVTIGIDVGVVNDT